MATVDLTADFPPGLPFQPFRISVERYHAMLAQGFFAENERCELLNGVLVERRSKNPPHTFVTRRCVQLLQPHIPAGLSLISQDPITLATSEPEPDLAIVTGSLDAYAQRHPQGNEVVLVIEVADRSLATDRYKAGIYAAAQIPFYWLVNLNERVIEVYSSPRLVGERWEYSLQKQYLPHDLLPVQFAGQTVSEIAVRDLLPPGQES